MTIIVEAINIDSLPATEAAAIRVAEKEAADFYQAIEDEEARITALRDVCSLMITNKYVAHPVVVKRLETDILFTTAEKEALVFAASTLTGDDNDAAIMTYRFTRSVNNLFLASRHGYVYDFTTAELINRITPKAAPKAARKFNLRARKK